MKSRNVLHHAVFGLLIGWACAPSFGADWKQFRGTDNSSIGDANDLPTTFGENANIAWTKSLPGRGLSSPIVIGERVVVTASSGADQDRLHVLCFSARSGEQFWERQFWATGNTTCHPKTSMAAPTPASDGQRIFAFYSTNDLFCLDLDGNLLWLRGLTSDYPNASNSVGMSSSPVVVEDVVVVQIECQSDSFVAGIDTNTGENIWKIDRPRGANWASPVVLPLGPRGAKAVLLQCAGGVAAVEPRTGKKLWEVEGKCSTIPSAVVAGDTIFVPVDGLAALKMTGPTDKPEVIWKEQRLGPSTPSPIVYQDRVYIINGAGVLNCADAKSGAILWRLRLKGPFSSTPVAARGLLFIANEEGTVHVVRPGDQEGAIVGTGNLGEMILCTPAVALDALFVRSDGKLWKVAKSL